MKIRFFIIIGIFLVIFSTNELLSFDSSLLKTTEILTPLQIQYANASCVSDYLEPCFDGFTKHDETFTESSLRNYFADYADRVYEIYDYPNKSEDMKNNFTGFPAIVCYEIMADKKPYLLMAKWMDNTISDVKNYYAPELCEITLNPFHEENRPDSLFKKLDVPNCKWIVENEFPTFMDLGCYPEPLGNPLRDISLSKSDDPQRLEFILEHCAKHGPLPYAGPLRYLNATHLIDIDTCIWDTRTNSGITLDRTVYPTPTPKPESDVPPFVKGLSKLQKAVREDISIGNYRFNDVVHGGGIANNNLHITINPEITDPVEQEEIFQELVIILGFDSFEINFAKPVQQDKALCEDENTILQDGICMKKESSVCKVYHILGYAIDDCNNHIPIFLIISALVIICATGAFIYTWRRK